MSSSVPSLRRLIAAALLCTIFSGSACAGGIEFEAAVRAFKSGRHADAYGRFVELANDGDTDAARVSLFMVRYGPLLYGSHWDATADEERYWARIASRDTGRPLPVFVPLAPTQGKGPVAAVHRTSRTGKARQLP